MRHGDDSGWSKTLLRRTREGLSDQLDPNIRKNTFKAKGLMEDDKDAN